MIASRQRVRPCARTAIRAVGQNAVGVSAELPSGLTRYGSDGLVAKLCEIQDDGDAAKAPTTVALGARNIALSDPNAAVYFGPKSSLGAWRFARLGPDFVFQVATDASASGLRWETRLTVPGTK